MIVEILAEIVGALVLIVVVVVVVVVGVVVVVVGEVVVGEVVLVVVVQLLLLQVLIVVVEGDGGCGKPGRHRGLGQPDAPVRYQHLYQILC